MMTQNETSFGTGRYVRLENGLTVYYEEYGEGYPLVLLHGSLDCVGSMWKPQIPALAENFRVIVPDLRGHGRTDNAEEKITLELLARDALELGQALGLDRPALCGLSMGARATLEAGIRYPNAFAALIAIAGQRHRPFPPEMLEKTRACGIMGPGDVDPEILERTDPRRVERLRMTHARSPDQWKDLSRQLSYAWYPPLRPVEDYRKIAVPTLLIVGDRDHAVRVEDVLEMFRALPMGELAVLPNRDHCSVLGAAGPMGPIVLDFLSRRVSRKRENGKGAA